MGAGAMVGAFVNLVEYVADVAPDDGDCALEATHELSLNMGAFAKVGVSFEKKGFVGLKPEATTTLLTLPLPSACLLESGLPVPVRNTPLPVAGECAAETTGSGVTGKSRPTETSSADDDDEEDDDDKVTMSVTKKPTTLKTTTTPSTTTATPGGVYVIPRAEPAVEEITAVACISKMADCPENLKTTLTYKSTACAPAPTKTGGFFDVTGASTLKATSVVTSKAAATATGTAGKVRRRYRR